MKRYKYTYPQGFVVRRVGRIWQAQMYDPTTIDWISNLCGSGSRPELAIRDWKEQYRRWGRKKGASKQCE